MTVPARRGTKPVWERGRAGRLFFGLLDHAQTAWWGLVSPRLGEAEPLVIVQAVILRPSPNGTTTAPARATAAATGAAVGAAVASEGPADEVLLSVRRELFGWELPGGTPLPGESLESALVREVQEETGLTVEPDAEVGRWVRRGFRPHTAVVFRCHVVSGQERPSEETPKLGWFPAARPPAALLPWFSEPLARSLERNAAAVRVEEWQGVAAILAGLRIDLRLRWQGLD